MDDFWKKQSTTYGEAADLEEQIRQAIVTIVSTHAKILSLPVSVFEAGCGNGKVLEKLAKLSTEIIKEACAFDSSSDMVMVARGRVSDSRFKIVVGDICDAEPFDGEKYDIVYCCNTLHNLPSRKNIYEAMRNLCDTTKPGGKVVIDIRNSWNPFLSYGYYKNRKNGLQFYTTSPLQVRRILKEQGFEIEHFEPVSYDSVDRAGKDGNVLYRFAYRMYLYLMKIPYAAQYIFVVARKKTPEFTSVIYGYHKQLTELSEKENYHHAVLSAAHNIGYQTNVISLNSTFDPRKDDRLSFVTSFYSYVNCWSYIRSLWEKRNGVIYANSFVWQSLIVGMIGKKTIFMGHDSVKRKTFVKRLAQRIFFSFFTYIRVVTNEEKEYLIGEGHFERKIIVLPLAIDIENFKRKKEDISGNGIVVLGNITDDKDCYTIARAFARVLKSFPRETLTFIGENRDPGFLTFIKSLGIEENIVFRGFISHRALSSELGKYRIYVNTSISEGQCLATYESAVSGLILCLPNTLSFSGVFKDIALFHELYDHERLANNIIEAIQMNEKECVKRVRAAERLVSFLCDYDHIQRETELLLRNTFDTHD